MHLASGIYYYECEDVVYLRNVEEKKDFLLSSIVFDILEYIKANPGCGEMELCTQLLQLYEIEDLEEFREDIRQFLEELETEKIILRKDQKQENIVSVSQQLEQMYEQQGRILSATLELTYRCSEKCIHCYVDDNCAQAPAPELGTEEYKDILDQLKQMGCIRLLLTGGEVCLRKDLVDIARYAVELGFLVDVYTNGISMTDEQFDALCALKPNSVSFSMYSGDSKVHDAITRVPGSFEKTLKRAMMFKCAGVDTFIKTVVIRQNLDTLDSLFQLGKRLNIEVTPATSIADAHSGRSAQAFRLDTPELRSKALQILDKNRYQPVAFENRDLDGPVCKAGISSLSIDPYGGVHPCLAFTTSIGSVRESKLNQIWKESDLLKALRAFRFRDLTPNCGKCTYRNHCAVCLGAAYEASGGKLCPGVDSCDWAKSNYESRRLQNRGAETE